MLVQQEEGTLTFFAFLWKGENIFSNETIFFQNFFQVNPWCHAEKGGRASWKMGRGLFLMTLSGLIPTTLGNE